MRNVLVLLAIVLSFAFVSQANAQYGNMHQHGGQWHQHPYSGFHYHNQQGYTYYPPMNIYRGWGIWSYIPPAVVGPRRSIIINPNGVYWYYNTPRCVPCPQNNRR